MRARSEVRPSYKEYSELLAGMSAKVCVGMDAKTMHARLLEFLHTYQQAYPAALRRSGLSLLFKPGRFHSKKRVSNGEVPALIEAIKRIDPANMQRLREVMYAFLRYRVAGRVDLGGKVIDFVERMLSLSAGMVSRKTNQIMLYRHEVQAINARDKERCDNPDFDFLKSHPRIKPVHMNLLEGRVVSEVQRRHLVNIGETMAGIKRCVEGSVSLRDFLVYTAENSLTAAAVNFGPVSAEVLAAPRSSEAVELVAINP